jgi:hypothetical protein
LFKKNLTGFLRAYITDGAITLEERMQKAIDRCNDPELTPARNNFSHVPTITTDSGTVGQISELIVVQSQQPDTNNPMPRKSPDDGGTQDHSSEPPRKRHRGEGDVTAEPEDLLGFFPDSWGKRQTLDSLWTPEMRLKIKDGYRRQSTLKRSGEELFMKNCFKFAKIVIVSAPSRYHFPERRLKILATIFSNDPRLEIFSLIQV